MAEKEDRNEKISKALEMLKDGVKVVFSSDKYKNFLKKMSLFHDYSLNNQILITMQNPNARQVAGFTTWNKLNRTVKKGEKGLMILAPMKYKYKVAEKEDIKDESLSNEVKEDVYREYISFRPAYVFDISQTEGEELKLGTTLQGDEDKSNKLLDVLIKVSDVKVNFIELNNGANGYYDVKENEIFIKEDLPKKQMLKTLIHETAHSKLHTFDKYCETKKDEKEIEAESVAYVVCNYLGIDSSEYSFPYVTNWSNDKDSKYLQSVLEKIKECSSEIIDKVNKELENSKEVVKESIKDRLEKAKEKALEAVCENANEKSKDLAI